MLISTKVLGSRKPLFEDFSVPLPPNWNQGGDGGDGDVTLRDVIERVVCHEVQAFRKRQSDRQFIRTLTASEIQTAAERGKIEMGGSEVAPQSVDEDQAVAAAWTAFEDGLYMVVIDEVQYKELDQAVFLTADSKLTFIRLTLLTGA
jgi:hypothetical protein